MASNAVGTYLREHLKEITDRWETEVQAEAVAVRRLDRSVLVDHMPEFIDALARWVDGDTESAWGGFDALAEGHALQRLGHRIDLNTLTLEYGILRRVILQELLNVESTPAVRQALIDCNVGIDHGVREAVHRYTKRRDEVRERFIGILGHDLRNPLNTIVMAIGLLQNGEKDPARQKLLATIRRSTDRMTRMIGDVIDFALGHLGGGIPARPEPMDMGEVCRAVVEELQLVHPERAIVVSVEGDLSGAWDRDRVHQALSNVIGNALQHGQEPFRVRASADGERAVLTEVTNGGPAIAREALASLFDPFQRGSEHKVKAGLGLGLYIVRQIAIAHGAVCSIASDEGSTRFSIRWPRVPLDELPDRF